MLHEWFGWLRWKIVLPAMLFLALGGWLLVWGIAVSLRTSDTPTAPAPTLMVIYAPSATPTASPTPRVTPTPTLNVPPPPPPGVLAPGAYVQISGTGGDGLRLRADAGLNAEVRFLGLEAEVFRISDGPREVDGYVWFNLVAPYDETRTGWAASNFLAVVQAP